MEKNKIVLGTVQMGVKYGINQTQPSTVESQMILKKAHNKGIRYLDTAEAYGTAHKLIGDYHTQNPDHKFKIITKFPTIMEEDIRDKIVGFINILKVEELEALLFHSYDFYSKKGAEVISGLKVLKQQKVINKIGVSIYTNAEFESVLSDDDIDIIQLPYNLLDNFNLRGDLLRLAKSRNKIIHTRSAFLQGLFFRNPLEEHRIVVSLRKEIELIRAIAKEENVDIASLALNYCLQEELIDNVLIGVDSVNQLEQNLSVIKHKLSYTSIRKINQIIIHDKDLLNPSLWN